MFGDFGSFIQTALGFIAIASLAGVALQRANVKGLRERIDDYEKEVAEKERRLTEAEVEIAKLHALNSAQRTDLDALGRVVTGEAHWTSIGQKLDEHHDEAKKHWLADEDKLDKINAALRGKP